MEHIISENTNDLALNIGNLILLEKRINEKAEDKSHIEKKNFYAQSKYPWVSHFLREYSDWDDTSIEKRASKLAKIYYTEILKKEL